MEVSGNWAENNSIEFFACKSLVATPFHRPVTFGTVFMFSSLLFFVYFFFYFLSPLVSWLVLGACTLYVVRAPRRHVLLCVSERMCVCRVPYRSNSTLVGLYGLMPSLNERWTCGRMKMNTPIETDICSYCALRSRYNMQRRPRLSTKKTVWLRNKWFNCIHNVTTHTRVEYEKSKKREWRNASQFRAYELIFSL